MTAILQCIDAIASTKKALANYGAMQAILDHTDQEIKEVYEQMENYRTIVVDDAFGIRTMQADEDDLIRSLDEVALVQKRYEIACHFMMWFQPAWEGLSENDRFILQTFYMEDLQNDMMSAVDIIAEKYDLARTAAYKRKDRAIERLSILLYGTLC